MKNKPNEVGGKIIAKWVAAISDIVTPGKSVLAREPAVVVLGGPALSSKSLTALSIGASSVDADLIYLTFEEGHEANGPNEILSVAYRAPVHHIQRELELWIGDDGEVILVPKGMKGVHTFAAGGMDYTLIDKARLTPEGFKRGMDKPRAMVAAPGAREAGKSILRAA